MVQSPVIESFSIDSKSDNQSYLPLGNCFFIGNRLFLWLKKDILLTIVSHFRRHSHIKGMVRYKKSNDRVQQSLMHMWTSTGGSSTASFYFCAPPGLFGSGLRQKRQFMCSDACAYRIYPRCHNPKPQFCVESRIQGSSTFETFE